MLILSSIRGPGAWAIVPIYNVYSSVIVKNKQRNLDTDT